MGAVALTLVLFAGWTLIGLGVVAVHPEGLRSMRLALCAPVVGACTTTLLSYLFSVVGLTVADTVRPMVVVLVLAAVVLIARRRPRVSVWTVVPFGLGVLTLVVMARPM